MKRPLFVACLAAILGASLWLLVFPPAYFSYGESAGKEVCLTGRVYAKEWKKGEQSPVLIIYIETKQLSLSESNREIPYKDNFICTLKDASEPSIGSTVTVKGVLAEYEKASNPGQFDAKKHYAVFSIFARINRGELIRTDGGRDTVKEGLWQCRNALGAVFDRLLLPGDAAVLKTMLLGEKASLEEEIKTLYKEAGIVHILAISGLHVSLLGMGLYRLLKKLCIKTSAAAVICAMVMFLYGGMVGMPVSVVRALFMFAMRLFADCLGRTYDMATALSVCALMMVVEQPLYLTYSGFQLSFLSVLAVGMLRPALAPPDKKLPRIGDLLLASLAIMLFTLPVQLYTYFEIPVYAPLFNLAVLPLVGILLMLGMAALVLFPLTPWLAGIAASLIHMILGFYSEGSRFLGKLPGNLWNPGRPEVWQIAVYALLMALALFMGKIRYRHRIGLILGAVLMFGIKTGGGLTVTFLDVGQGDCICLELPDGSAWLFDGGSSSVSKVGKYRMEPFLKSRGIKALDIVFLSHGDSDHINGVEELLQSGRVEIKLLALPVTAKETGGEGFGNIFALAGQKGIPVLWLQAGTEWESGGVHAVCLHPSSDFSWRESNACSEVIYLSYGGFSMLLTGDVEGQGESALVEKLYEEKIDNVTVLKVAHHGSDGGTREAFLQQLFPKIAVISCGRDNRYGHPHKALWERLSEKGCDIRVTAGEGAVMFRTDGRVLKRY